MSIGGCDLLFVRRVAMGLLQPAQGLSRLVECHVDQVAQVMSIRSATRSPRQRARVSATRHAVVAEQRASQPEQGPSTVIVLVLQHVSREQRGTPRRLFYDQLGKLPLSRDLAVTSGRSMANQA